MKLPPLLLLNPWIHDVAAYDFFARPLGLLYLAGLLESLGFEVHLIDCLAGPHARLGRFGTGRYPKQALPTPPALADVPRRYGRYGISITAFREALGLVPRPAAILVTSLMTYWYPGVQEAVCLAREHFPGVPVWLGGIYATLCPEHARQLSGADEILPGPGETEVVRRLSALVGVPLPLPDPEDLDGLPYPALHLATHLGYLPLLTSRGCPLACDYCASRLLVPRPRRRRPAAVVEELLHWQRLLHLEDVVFYDDALLLDADSHLLVILEELARRGVKVRFHTPNGLHARYITREVAGWLKRSGFHTLRLGVESAAPGAVRRDAKLGEGEWQQAVRHLRDAGFAREELGVYLLVGLPHQTDAEVEASIRQVQQAGATPVLALYSPIPGTALWPEALAASRYPLAADPLYHNNSLFPCWPAFSWERYTRLKKLCQEG